MARHDIIVVGASAGGVEALSQLVAGLPADLPAAILVVLHLPPTGTSVLPTILSRAGNLPAVAARDGMALEPGCIYVAPPDRHLMVSRGRVRVMAGPRENGHRPSVDPLFRSAARTYGRRVAGVILSGSLDDGAIGLAAVKLRGGVAIVQSPEDALFSGMPTSAIERTQVDYVLPITEIPPVLVHLATADTVGEEAAPMMDDVRDVVSEEVGISGQGEGPPSVFTCPECHGTLFLTEDGRLEHYRCRVGHSYTDESLLAAQSEALEAALWAALRALEEKASLARRMCERAQSMGHQRMAGRYRAQVADASQAMDTVRQAIERVLPSANGSESEESA